jgi:ferritin
MLSEKMNQALNEHLNAELYSAYLYLSMSAYFEHEDLPGLAHWMQIQAQEELVHVMKVYDYINDRHGRVLLGGVSGPPTDWDGPVSVIGDALDHEVQVSKRINVLVDLAVEESDHSTHNFLQWFVAEQVEEEATVNTLLQKAKRVESAPGGLFMLDQEAAGRTLPAGA